MDDYKDESACNVKGDRFDYSDSMLSEKHGYPYGSDLKVEATRDNHSYLDNKFNVEGSATAWILCTCSLF